MQWLFFYGIAALAVVNYAILGIIAKKVEAEIPPFAFIAITMAILTVLAFFASFLFEKSFNIGNIVTSQVVLLLLFAFVNLASFFFFLKAITGIPVPHYQLMAVLVGPIASAVLAYLFLGQEVGARFFVALPIIFAGLYMALMK